MNPVFTHISKLVIGKKYNLWIRTNTKPLHYVSELGEFEHWIYAAARPVHERLYSLKFTLFYPFVSHIEGETFYEEICEEKDRTLLRTQIFKDELIASV